MALAARFIMKKALRLQSAQISSSTIASVVALMAQPLAF